VASDSPLPLRASAILCPDAVAAWAAPVEAIQESTEPADEAKWRSDLRLFAITFAGGFVFFLTFLA
jgi:hypothetical protein